MIYFITTWTSSGIITGTGISPDGTLPKEAISCTQAQYENSSQYTVDASTTPPTIQQAPASVLLTQAQATQIALLQSAFQKAEQAPVSITLASGVTTSFGMTPHDWTKIVGLYSKYVVKGDPIPSGYQIPDAKDTLQAVTVADIENLFNAGETQMTGAIAKLASLVGQVEAATTVSAVQAIVW